MRKPNGRVRRVLAQHFAPHVLAACMPYQYGLRTHVGNQAVSWLLRTAPACCRPYDTSLTVFPDDILVPTAAAQHGHPHRLGLGTRAATAKAKTAARGRKERAKAAKLAWTGSPKWRPRQP